MKLRVLVASGLAVVALAGLLVSAHAVSSATPPSEESQLAVPVLVELFTSEGCSSCPPADEFLSRLIATQPVKGARVIALGEHVDYWDRQGWRDPFSSAAFTARQSDYSRVLRGNDIYTPQLVVNGRKGLVGSDYAAATAAIAAAAREATGRVRLTVSTVGDSASDGASDGRGGTAPPTAWVRVAPEDGTTFSADLDVLLAVTEDGLSNDVRRGENKGRTLHHSAVTRTLDGVGVVRKGSPAWSVTRAMPLDKSWARERLSLVAFARDRTTHRIVGADRVAPYR